MKNDRNDDSSDSSNELADKLGVHCAQRMDEYVNGDLTLDDEEFQRTDEEIIKDYEYGKIEEFCRDNFVSFSVEAIVDKSVAMKYFDIFDKPFVTIDDLGETIVGESGVEYCKAKGIDTENLVEVEANACFDWTGPIKGMKQGAFGVIRIQELIRDLTGPLKDKVVRVMISNEID